MTAPEFKAKAILDMGKEKPPYSVILKNNEGTPYASLVPDGAGKMTLQVLNLAVFKEQAERFVSPEAQVLREITRQTAEETTVVDSVGAEVVKFCANIDENIAIADSILRSEAKDNPTKSFKKSLQQLKENEHEKENRSDLADQSKITGPKLG